MIYVTLGTMFLDFPRLIRAMDAVAESGGEDVVMQLGLSRTIPRYARYFDFKPHDEVIELQRGARVIVAHAGIGTTLDALRVQRPLIVVPRLKRYGEHMNDHQVDLAEAVARRGWGRMVLDAADLPEACASPPAAPAAYRPAKEALVGAIRMALDNLTAWSGR